MIDGVPRREQFNAITAYLDLSSVYGSTSSVLNVLREYQGGRLISSGNNLLTFGTRVESTPA